MYVCSEVCVCGYDCVCMCVLFKIRNCLLARGTRQLTSKRMHTQQCCARCSCNYLRVLGFLNIYLARFVERENETDLVGKWFLLLKPWSYPRDGLVGFKLQLLLWHRSVFYFFMIFIMTLLSEDGQPKTAC